MIRILSIILSFLFFLTMACSGSSDTSKSSTSPATTVSQKSETKEEYISSTKKIGRQKSAIYYKDFLKNPSSFKGQRVSVLGKIAQIEETQGATGLQMHIYDGFKAVLVFYPGNLKLYDGDMINVYGEVGEEFKGQNNFGASLTSPTIRAKYIIKTNK